LVPCESCVPVQEDRQYAQVAEVGERFQLLAREQGRMLTVKQRVEAALGGQKRRVAGHAHRGHLGERRAAKLTAVAA
jgi:hypothetical protein